MTRPPVKHLFRFSLGTMFVLVTVFSVVLGLKVRQVERQKESVAWVYDHGGGASYDYEISETAMVTDISPHYEPKDPPWPHWMQQSFGEDYLAPIHMVVLDGSGMNGDLPVTSLEPLSAFTELRHLILMYCELDDWSPLRKLTKLRTLELVSCPISCEEMAELRRVLPDCKVVQWGG